MGQFVAESCVISSMGVLHHIALVDRQSPIIGQEIDLRRRASTACPARRRIIMQKVVRRVVVVVGRMYNLLLVGLTKISVGRGRCVALQSPLDNDLLD